MFNNIPSIYPWQKWPHRQYLLSQTRARLSLAERGAFSDLKDIAATQTPFGSIPNDDNAIAGWLMISVKQWLKIKINVLADWILDNGRYFLPMLIETAHNIEETHETILLKSTISTTPKSNKTKEPSPELSAVRSQAAYASHQKRRDNKEAREKNSKLQLANDLQTKLQNSNLQIAKPLQNGGIKGGDLDLEQDLNKDLVVVNQAIVNNQNAHKIEKSATPQQTTKFFMNFDFKIEPSELEPFMAKLEVPMSKHSSHTLGNFISYYVTKSYQNTRQEWVFQYAKWLERQREEQIEQPTITSKPVAEFIQPVKPLWEILDEQKQQQQANAKTAEQLAKGDDALANLRKQLGLKAA